MPNNFSTVIISAIVSALTALLTQTVGGLKIIGYIFDKYQAGRHHTEDLKAATFRLRAEIVARNRSEWLCSMRDHTSIWSWLCSKRHVLLEICVRHKIRTMLKE